MRRLCRYACRPEGCYQRNLFHLERFAHPGDEEWPVLISSDDEAFGEPALGSPAGSSPGEPPVPADRWLAELNDGASSKKRRRAPALDATALPVGSVRAEVAARQAEKVEALRRAQAERGEAPLELPPPLSDEEDPIEREEKRLCEEEETFMASLKRIRQEERGIVPLPEKLKEVLKAQRAAFGAKLAGAEDQDEADGAAQVSTRAFRVARAAALDLTWCVYVRRHR